MKTRPFEARAALAAVAALVIALLLLAPSPTITATGLAALRPGATVALDLVFANPHPYAITVTSVTVALGAVTDPRSGRPSACELDNFSITNPTRRAHFVIPAYGRASYSTLHVKRSSWPQVRMVNDERSQDGCRRVTLRLDYRSTGIPGSEP